MWRFEESRKMVEVSWKMCDLVSLSHWSSLSLNDISNWSFIWTRKNLDKVVLIYVCGKYYGKRLGSVQRHQRCGPLLGSPGLLGALSSDLVALWCVTKHAKQLLDLWDCFWLAFYLACDIFDCSDFGGHGYCPNLSLNLKLYSDALLFWLLPHGHHSWASWDSWVCASQGCNSASESMAASWTVWAPTQG